MPPLFAESLGQDSPDEESQSLGWAGDTPFVGAGSITGFCSRSHQRAITLSLLLMLWQQGAQEGFNFLKCNLILQIWLRKRIRPKQNKTTGSAQGRTVRAQGTSFLPRSLEPLLPTDPPLAFATSRSPSLPGAEELPAFGTSCHPAQPEFPLCRGGDLGFPETCPIFCFLLWQSQEPAERTRWGVPCPELRSGSLAPGSCLFLLYLWVDVGAFDHPGLLQHYELPNSSGCSGYKSGSCSVLCLCGSFDAQGKGEAGTEHGGMGWGMACVGQVQLQVPGAWLGVLAGLPGD